MSSSFSRSGSYAVSSSNAFSSSYALSSSYSLSGSYALTASYVNTLGSSNFVANFAASTTWTINHNLNTQYVIIQTFDNSNNQILPQEITLVSSTQATATFTSPEAGYAVVTVGGALLNYQAPAGNANNVQFNNGGVFGGSDVLYFDGATFIVTDPDQVRDSFRNESALFSTSQMFHTTRIDGKYMEEFSSTSAPPQFVGDQFTPKAFGGSATYTEFDVVYLESDNYWYPVDQFDTTKASRLLAITNRDKEIVTEGYITVVHMDAAATDAVWISGSLTSGAPVYLQDWKTYNGSVVAPYLSTQVPTTGSIRIVGHLFYQNANDNSNYWFMRFRPDHTWSYVP